MLAGGSTKTWTWAYDVSGSGTLLGPLLPIANGADFDASPSVCYAPGADRFLAFEKSGDLSMARRSFEECIRRYPYSTPAASAKLELKRIKY